MFFSTMSEKRKPIGKYVMKEINEMEFRFFRSDDNFVKINNYEKKTHKCSVNWSQVLLFTLNLSCEMIFLC
jgi:hypothetical protein